MRINKKKFNNWMIALRSGQYSQTTETLQDTRGYCCLGVACEILIPKNKIILDEDGFIKGRLPKEQEPSPTWLKLIDKDFGKKTGTLIQTLNDLGAEGLEPFSFDELADLLELVYIHKALQ